MELIIFTGERVLTQRIKSTRTADKKILFDSDIIQFTFKISEIRRV